MALEQTPSPARAAADRLRSVLPLSTDRLLLRALVLDDVASVTAYRSLPEVTRYLGHPPLDEAGVRDRMAGWQAERTGVSVGLVLPAAPDQVIGDVRVSLHASHAMAPARTDAVDAWIGYAVHPGHQGRGLATEAVGLVVRTLLDPSVVGVRRITAKVFSGAVASSRLLGRLGFHLDGVDRAAALAPDGSAWWDDEGWSLLASDLRARQAP